MLSALVTSPPHPPAQQVSPCGPWYSPPPACHHVLSTQQQEVAGSQAVPEVSKVTLCQQLCSLTAPPYRHLRGPNLYLAYRTFGVRKGLVALRPIPTLSSLKETGGTIRCAIQNTKHQGKYLLCPRTPYAKRRNPHMHHHRTGMSAASKQVLTSWDLSQYAAEVGLGVLDASTQRQPILAPDPAQTHSICLARHSPRHTGTHLPRLKKCE